MTAEQRHAVATRVASRRPPGADHAALKKVGRPKGEPATMVNVRLPLARLESLRQ